MTRRTNFKYPEAIATTRRVPQYNRFLSVGLVGLTTIALLISPLLSLGLVGLMLWQAWQQD